MNILLLHPGAMGASIGAALVANGHGVRWVSAGRSAATRKRAEDAGLAAVETLGGGLASADVVLSVCPPDSALDVAAEVRRTGCSGPFVDANAVSPTTAAKLAELFGERYVDGGIVGPPAWREGATRMYLSGANAAAVATLFAGSLVDARAIDGGPGAASALKMCYAAFTKGSSALLLGVRALAEHYDVTAELLAEWCISQPGLEARSDATARATSAKAWRFEGEMREIAATFSGAELPSGFHDAAASLYARMAPLKDVSGGADIDTVLKAILR